MRKALAIMAGADNVEVPPVPISNTEVKLDRAENTWLETTWEDRKVPALFLLYGLFGNKEPNMAPWSSG